MPPNSALAALEENSLSSKVFISYRRDDSAGHAGRVHDRLQAAIGQDLLFMDVDAIPLGVNFAEKLKSEVSKCDVLLAIIGPNWTTIKSDSGVRRLDDPSDFVRIEIGTALKRGIPVIPVILDGAKIPTADELPEDLRELALRNGLDVRHASFHSDIDRLVERLLPTDQGHSNAAKYDSQAHSDRIETSNSAMTSALIWTIAPLLLLIGAEVFVIQPANWGSNWLLYSSTTRLLVLTIPLIAGLIFFSNWEFKLSGASLSVICIGAFWMMVVAVGSVENILRAVSIISNTPKVIQFGLPFLMGILAVIALNMKNNEKKIR